LECGGLTPLFHARLDERAALLRVIPAKGPFRTSEAQPTRHVSGEPKGAPFANSQPVRRQAAERESEVKPAHAKAFGLFCIQ
jgi:hypothetical protein